MFLSCLLCVCADFFTGSDSIQGTWCKDILQTIMNFTPHNWASHTLSCFPAPLQVRYSQLGIINLILNAFLLL